MIDAWLLPEDGEYDEQAVAMAANGELPKYSFIDGSPVRLTHTERRQAAAIILRLGGTPGTVMDYLHLPSYGQAKALCFRLRAKAWRARKEG